MRPKLWAIDELAVAYVCGNMRITCEPENIARLKVGKPNMPKE